MATIGSFKKSENGDYAGAVKTLTLNVKARITPVEKTNDKAPDFRIYAGRTRSSSAPRGRRPRTKAASISRSSSTIRASRHRSTPRWSRSRAKTASRSSGRAATAIELINIATPRPRRRGVRMIIIQK